MQIMMQSTPNTSAISNGMNTTFYTATFPVSPATHSNRGLPPPTTPDHHSSREELTLWMLVKCVTWWWHYGDLYLIACLTSVVYPKCKIKRFKTGATAYDLLFVPSRCTGQQIKRAQFYNILYIIIAVCIIIINRSISIFFSVDPI